jgi:beta-lactam-binding protein with PASTA domain
MRNVRILIAVIAAFLLVVPAALAQVKPQPAPVPNVAGMPLNIAQKALVSAGFNAVVTQENVADPNKNNIVLKQQVPPGTNLAKGSSVPVVVGRYTAPAQVKVPYVTGKPVAEAQKILVENKLNAQVTMQPVAEPQRNGVVIGQKVAVGTPLAPGSMVPVVVGQYTPPATMPVPNATGMKAETARQMFEKQGWKVNIEERPVGDSRQAGMVLQQVPPPGTQVQQKNQPVTLVVGKAQETVRVPQVSGMKLQEAQAALAKVKLNAQVSSQPVANPQQNGVVIGQRVAPGTPVAPGSMVPVIVGAYTAPARPVVPNVTGMPVAEAQKTLAAGRLNAVVSLENVTDQGKKGIVLKQQIAAGTALDPGSQVPLVVGRYVEPLRVPSVVGMKGEQAKAVLEQAKLKMNAGARTVQDRTKIGTVLDQNPAPGTAVEPGSQVIVTMGLDPNKKINLPPSNPYSPYNPPIPADGTSSRK